jgi:hypothetical protein
MAVSPFPKFHSTEVTGWAGGGLRNVKVTSRLSHPSAGCALKLIWEYPENPVSNKITDKM